MPWYFVLPQASNKTSWHLLDDLHYSFWWAWLESYCLTWLIHWLRETNWESWNVVWLWKFFYFLRHNWWALVCRRSEECKICAKCAPWWTGLPFGVVVTNTKWCSWLWQRWVNHTNEAKWMATYVDVNWISPNLLRIIRSIWSTHWS
jgi:hypothetical protein